MKKLTDDIKNILMCCKDDSFHITKRMRSFDLLDKYLDLCNRNICPVITENDIYHLADISIEGYIRERAYYYTIPKDRIIGNDDKDRYCMAWNKLQKVYNCSMLTTIDQSIFMLDTKEVEFVFREQARRRKAYWAYLSNSTNNHICNYCKSCDFIEQQKKQ